MKRRSEAVRDAVAVLISGGLDSGVLLYEMSRRFRRVVPIYIRHGLYWEPAEQYWLKRFLAKASLTGVRPLETLEFPLRDLYRGHWSVTGRGIPAYDAPDADVYLPGRNVILLAKSAVYCGLHGIPAVAMGLLRTNPFADSTPAFFGQIGKALSMGLEHSVTILAPYRRLTKPQVIRRGNHLPLELTFSCLRPRGRRHCGRCSKCAERIKAFEQAKVPDRTVYDRSPVRP
jgi:7-cyano-7-deazaguanine synthase